MSTGLLALEQKSCFARNLERSAAGEIRLLYHTIFALFNKYRIGSQSIWSMLYRYFVYLHNFGGMVLYDRYLVNWLKA